MLTAVRAAGQKTRLAKVIQTLVLRLKWIVLLLRSRCENRDVV